MINERLIDRIDNAAKVIIDLATELKERKLILVGIKEETIEITLDVPLAHLNNPLDSAYIGFPEGEIEKNDFLHITTDDIDVCYWTGKPFPNQHQPRIILLTFNQVRVKQMIIRAKGWVKDTEDGPSFYINDDLLPNIKALRPDLWRLAGAAKDQGLDAKVSGNKVMIANSAYGADELEMIPKYEFKVSKQEKNTGYRHVFYQNEEARNWVDPYLHALNPTPSRCSLTQFES